MKEEIELRMQLVNNLTMRQAHMTYEDAVAGFPLEHVNTRPVNVVYSFWHLLEHLRLAQKDILDYIVDPDYEEPDFPAGLWPALSAETDSAGWHGTIEQFLADRQRIVDIVNNLNTDLFAQIPHGWAGHNVLREALIVADHNAYHVGELGILRGVMRLW